MTTLFRRERLHANALTFPSGITSNDLLLTPAAGTVRSFHIAGNTVGAGETGPVLSEGVFELPKNSTADFSFGEAVYVATAPTQLEEQAVGRWRIGYCVNPGGAGVGTTVALVKLHGAPIDQET